MKNRILFFLIILLMILSSTGSSAQFTSPEISIISFDMPQTITSDKEFINATASFQINIIENVTVWIEYTSNDEQIYFSPIEIIQVNKSQLVTIPLNLPILNSGQTTITISAGSYNNLIQEKREITIQDITAPVVSLTKKNDPFRTWKSSDIKGTIADISNISISSTLVSSNQTRIITPKIMPISRKKYFFELPLLGNLPIGETTIYLEICDSSNNCNQVSEKILIEKDCTGREILTVTDNQTALNGLDLCLTTIHPFELDESVDILKYSSIFINLESTDIRQFPKLIDVIETSDSPRIMFGKSLYDFFVQKEVEKKRVINALEKGSFYYMGVEPETENNLSTEYSLIQDIIPHKTSSQIDFSTKQIDLIYPDFLVFEDFNDLVLFRDLTYSARLFIAENKSRVVGLFSLNNLNTVNGEKLVLNALEEIGQDISPPTTINYTEPSKKELLLNLNPSFSENLWFWWKWPESDDAEGVGGNISRHRDTTEYHSAPASARVEVKSNTIYPWEAQFVHGSYPSRNLTLYKDHWYRLEFVAKSNTSRQILASVANNLHPFEDIGLKQPTNLTTGWQTYSYTFQATKDNNESRIAFELGGTPVTAWFDDVMLFELIEDNISIDLGDNLTTHDNQSNASPINSTPLINQTTPTDNQTTQENQTTPINNTPPEPLIIPDGTTCQKAYPLEPGNSTFNRLSQPNDFLWYKIDSYGPVYLTLGLVPEEWVAYELDVYDGCMGNQTYTSYNNEHRVNKFVEQYPVDRTFYTRVWQRSQNWYNKGYTFSANEYSIFSVPELELIDFNVVGKGVNNMSNAVEVELRNNGRKLEHQFNVYVYENGSSIGHNTIYGLAHGASTKTTIRAEGLPGRHNLTLLIKPEPVADKYPRNNNISKEVSFEEPVIDISVDNLQVYGTQPYQNTAFRWDVTNKGNIEIHMVTTHIRINDSGGGGQFIYNIKPGETRSVSYGYKYYKKASRLISANAEITFFGEDMNPQDNSKNITRYWNYPLDITGYMTLPLQVCEGEIVNLSAFIKSPTYSDILSPFTVDIISQQGLIHQWNVENLLTRNIWLNTTTSFTKGDYNISLGVDTQHRIPEVNEQNNHMTRQLSVISCDSTGELHNWTINNQTIQNITTQNQSINNEPINNPPVQNTTDQNINITSQIIIPQNLTYSIIERDGILVITLSKQTSQLEININDTNASVNLSDSLILEDGFIAIDTENLGMNLSGTLIFSDVSTENFTILYSANYTVQPTEVCPLAICTNITRVGDVVIIEVTHFSSYKIEQESAQSQVAEDSSGSGGSSGWGASSGGGGSSRNRWRYPVTDEVSEPQQDIVPDSNQEPSTQIIEQIEEVSSTIDSLEPETVNNKPIFGNGQSIQSTLASQSFSWPGIIIIGFLIIQILAIFGLLALLKK